MKKINLIQTCAGGVAMRSLTKAFQDAGANVILADADISTLPPGSEQLPIPDPKNVEEYLKSVMGLCEKHDAFVYPHSDAEAMAVSGAKLCGYDIPALISSPVAVEETQRKDRLYSHHGRPEFWPAKQYEFGIVGSRILKPIRGNGSTGIIFRNIYDNEYIVVRQLHGDEYSVDILAKDGLIIDICYRKRNKARGGICVDATITRNAPEVIEHHVVNTVKFFGLTGPLCVQGFFSDNNFTITDVNHRFGGGSSMSVMAGWGGVTNYIRLLAGKEPKYNLGFDPVRIRRWYTEEYVAEFEMKCDG